MASSNSSASASSSATRGAGRSYFWCHQCSATTVARGDRDELLCGTCGSGFIEEMSAEPDAPNDEDDSWEDMDSVDAPQMDPFLQHIFASAVFPHGGVGGRPGFRSASIRAPRGRGGIEVRPHFVTGGVPGAPGDQFLQMLLSNLTGALAFEGDAGPMFPLYGNPGDYAWGRGGLDAVVTTLLNQMDGAGPPPLDGENIEKIPKIQISSEHVESKLQCSVCWDDFNLGEEVRKLVCEHIFHDGCIIPWLKLHATCPVCRKPQDASGVSDESGEARSTQASGSANGLASTSMAASTSQQGPSTAGAPETAASIGNAISTVFNHIFGMTSPATSATSPTSSSSESSSTSSSSSSSVTSAAPSSSSSQNLPQPSSEGAANEPVSGQSNPPPSSFQDMDLE